MASPMTPERFQNRFEAFRGEPQQVSGVWTLHAAIAALPGSEAVLEEQAPWALTFNQKPAAPPTPAVPSGGLDPRGSEEAGMAGPQMAAPAQPGDSYLLVNDRDQDMEAYDHSGQFLWKIPCLARGQGADTDRTHTSTDTPPGLYKLGQLYADNEPLLQQLGLRVITSVADQLHATAQLTDGDRSQKERGVVAGASSTSRTNRSAMASPQP